MVGTGWPAPRGHHSTGFSSRRPPVVQGAAVTSWPPWLISRLQVWARRLDTVTSHSSSTAPSPAPSHTCRSCRSVTETSAGTVYSNTGLVIISDIPIVNVCSLNTDGCQRS